MQARSIAVVGGALLGLVLTACGVTSRRAGETTIVKYGGPGEASAALFTSGWNSDSDGASPRQQLRGVHPQFGDDVRFPTDVITIQVHDVYIDSVPGTLTGSKDIVVFADVWENGASHLDSNSSLTSIVGVRRNQMIPGGFNLTGRVVYGPTEFKGYPLTIRFTIMILQKDTGKRAASAADVLSQFTSMLPSYGSAISTALRGAREALLSQPDVVAFDYEITMLAEHPIQHMPLIAALSQGESAVHGGRDASRSKWQMVFPWLRYDMYAIVETKKRGNVAEADRVATHMPQLRLSGPVSVGAGTHRDIFGNNLTMRPGATILLFSITPGQLPIPADALLDASNKAKTQLDELRQNQRDIDGAFANMAAAFDDLKAAVLSIRLDDLARSVSNSVGTREEFLQEFGKQKALLTPHDPRDKQLFDRVVRSVEHKWESVYGQVAAPLGEGEAQSQSRLAADLYARARDGKALFDQAGSRLNALLTSMTEAHKRAIDSNDSEVWNGVLVQAEQFLIEAEDAVAQSRMRALQVRSQAEAAKSAASLAEGSAAALRKVAGEADHRTAQNALRIAETAAEAATSARRSADDTEQIIRQLGASEKQHEDTYESIQTEFLQIQEKKTDGTRSGR